MYKNDQKSFSSSMLDVSYNRPKFSACATWNPTAINFANSSTLLGSATGLFISTNNTVYATGSSLSSVLIWPEGTVSPSQSIFNDLSGPYRIFVTSTGDVYADNGMYKHRDRKVGEERNEQHHCDAGQWTM